MSKILDKIKGFGHSLTSMFQENDQGDEDYLNPDTKEAKELASAMEPAVKRMKEMEAKREKEEKDRIAWLKNLREGAVTEQESVTPKSNEVQVKGIAPKVKIGQSQDRTMQSDSSQNKDDLELGQWFKNYYNF